jgi:hypothetical protein
MSTSWNHLEVNFPMQETACPLDFPIKSYDQISEDCAGTQQSHEAVQDFSSWWLFTSHNSRNSKVHLHPTRRAVPCINTLCIYEIIKTFDNEIEPPLFSCVLTRLESDSLPLCSCDFPVGLHRRPLHRHPICAPGTSCSCCIGWFFESVIGRILDSGYRIETVVGFLCVSSGCTTYLTARSYLSWLIFS